MSVMGRVKGGLKSAAGSTWGVTKKLLVRVAIAAAIMVVAIALARHGESVASEGAGSGVSGTEAHPIAAQHAILSEGWVQEQSLTCKYTVKATFGVSIFTETDMGARRLIRLHNKTAVNGACDAVEGGKTIGCGGLKWETDWIRIQSGDAVGYAPASCLAKDGVL